MPTPYFRFKRFTVYHHRCAMKVTTDACLFGAWCADALAKAAEPPKRLLDVGAGTGLLSLMAAQKNEAAIDAVEIDQSAAEQAADNIAASPWAQRIRLVHADVLHWRPERQYDAIVSNPPFYQNDLRSANRQKNTAHHDESLQLKPLLFFIKNHLTDRGKAFLLLPAKREAEIREELANAGLFVHHQVRVRQTPAHGPFRLMIETGKEPPAAIVWEELTITDEGGNYTPAFTVLLKDYYLHL